MSRIFDDYNFDVSKCLKESTTETKLKPLPTSMMPVLEVYIGKTKELKAVDREFDMILNERRKDKLGYDLSSHNPHIKAVNELIKKQFGFKDFNLSFIPLSNANAFTDGGSVISKMRNRSSYTFTKNKGYYDTNHVIIGYVNIFEGMLDSDKLTGEMVTAFILHEIGHIFDTNPCMYLQMLFNVIMDPLAIIISPIVQGVMPKIIKIATDWLYTLNKDFLRGFKIGSNIVNFVSSIKVILKNISLLNSWREGNSIVLSNPMETMKNIPTSILGAHGEIHSDEVADTYGYSAALAQAHMLSDVAGYSTPRAVTNKAGVPGNVIYDVYNTLVKVMTIICVPALLINEHPSDQARIKNSIRKLNHDVETSDYSPAMKKQLLEDIKNTENLYNDYIECVRDEDKGRMFERSIREFKETVFKGKDWQNMIFNKHI